MKKNKLAIILLVILSLLFLLLIINFTVHNLTPKKENNIKEETKIKNYIDKSNLENATLENDQKVNISEKIKEEKNFNNLIFKNTKLNQENGKTKLTTTVLNTKDYNIDLIVLQVIFKDNLGKVIETMPITIVDLKVNEAKEIIGYVDADLINAYDYEIIEN